MIPTPHIAVTDKKQIAKTVFMPGDPLRAHYIAKNFLTNAQEINHVRNMLGYTGLYHGHPVTVFASGMGLSSMGIYSYELYQFYDVEQIIRIGSAGTYTEQLKLQDIVLATEAYSESHFAKTQNSDCNDPILKADHNLIECLERSAHEQKINYIKGRIHTCEVFYKQEPQQFAQIAAQQQCLCVEMEAFALFHNANIAGKQAACLLTISDSLVTQEKATVKEREESFTNMITMALGIVEL